VPGSEQAEGHAEPGHTDAAGADDRESNNLGRSTARMTCLALLR
jgi:hypothetical protein